MNDLWKKWTINCALGEIIGIACAGAIAYSINYLFGEPQYFRTKVLILISMMFAGLIEGTILGLFQWKVLVRKFDSIPQGEWMYYTILVTVLGWFLGMMPSLFFMPTAPQGIQPNEGINFSNPILFILFSLTTGLILGALFGLFQWFSLRKYADKAYKWIIANALGWGLGLGWIYLFASLPTEESSMFFIVLIGICGGLLAGLSVGAITGLFLIRLEKN
jgi:hypothetical protein